MKRACSYEPCGLPHAAKGYCLRHYQQWRLKGEVGPIRPMRKAGSLRERDEAGRKHCIYCNLWLPESSFGRGASTSDGLQTKCHKCTTLKKYNMTREQFDGMLSDQGGRCAICKTATPNGRGFWHVDHDHACCPGQGSCGGCVRGLLCHTCNTGLGSMQDSAEVLLAALDYLTKHTRKDNLWWPTPMPPISSGLIASHQSWRATA